MPPSLGGTFRSSGDAKLGVLLSVAISASLLSPGSDLSKLEEDNDGSDDGGDGNNEADDKIKYVNDGAAVDVKDEVSDVDSADEDDDDEDDGRDDDCEVDEVD